MTYDVQEFKADRSGRFQAAELKQVLNERAEAGWRFVRAVEQPDRDGIKKGLFGSHPNVLLVFERS